MSEPNWSGLAQAFEGHFDDHHAQLAKSILHRLDLVELAMAELDNVIAAECQPWAHQLELLQTIPGVGERVAQVAPEGPARSPDGMQGDKLNDFLGWFEDVANRLRGRLDRAPRKATLASTSIAL